LPRILRIASPCSGTSQRICSWLVVIPCSGQHLARLADDAVGRAPADERDVRVGRPVEHRRRHRGLDPRDLAHAFLHHGAALGVVGVLVRDEDAVLIVLIA
jgi:hypothetical protein